jgi:hypothetical protein
MLIFTMQFFCIEKISLVFFSIEEVLGKIAEEREGGTEAGRESCDLKKNKKKTMLWKEFSECSTEVVDLRVL